MADDTRGLIPKLERLAADATRTAEQSSGDWSTTSWYVMVNAQKALGQEAATATPLLCETIRELFDAIGALAWESDSKIADYVPTEVLVKLVSVSARARLLLDPDETGDRQ